ncbi:MAG: multicopper oxidase domain-containing protein [Desulfobacterales bacterium]|nr:multicopper oxidase domain-containing protein [Desulfobacterales bacterium]
MINRRDFLRFTGTGALTMLAGGAFTGVRSAWASEEQAFRPDVELSLRAAPTEAAILPGAPSQVWSFRGDLIKGPAGALQPMPASYLGPTIRVRRGQKVRIHFINDLPQESIVHWHGLHVPAEMDGHPRDVIETGQRFTYEFEVRNRAGTYWYHPHPHAKTGLQVYAGLAGMFIVDDAAEDRLDLPRGEHDLSLVLQDRLFNPDNQLVYLTHHMDRMTGFVGERILVNGRAAFRQAVAGRPYRLRLLNGSNARIYRLAWSDGRPLTVIGSDGGLLEKPLNMDTVMLGPAERVEVWVDFGRWGKNQEAVLVSKFIDLAAVSALPGMGRMGPRRGMMGTGVMPNGAPHTLAHFQVTSLEGRGAELPERLSPPEAFDSAPPDKGPPARRFEFAMNHMRGTINNRIFEMAGVAEEETVALNTSEIWEFVNRGGMPPLPHPIHVHGLQFKVLGRLGAPFDDVLDQGWKDTVLLMPGERVRLQMRFTDYPGLFLYHCHNLEHEDMGMMRNYYIRA